MMKSVSGISDPQEMVNVYGDAVDHLFPVDDWMAVSRRGLEFPSYRITRSSKYDRDFNPWKQRDELPILSGGLLGEVVYGNKPYVIEDLRVAKSDPAYEFLKDMRVLVIHWQTNLFGRATLNMVLKNQLALAYAQLDRELEVVGQMQRSLLPRELPRIDGVSLAARYETARRAGGDSMICFRWRMDPGDCSPATSADTGRPPR